VILDGVAFLVLATAALLLVVFSFLIAWKFLAHKTAAPNEVETNVKNLRAEMSGELKDIKIRLLTLEGSR